MALKMVLKPAGILQVKNPQKVFGLMEVKKGNGLDGTKMVNSKARSHLKTMFGMEAIPIGMKMVKK